MPATPSGEQFELSAGGQRAVVTEVGAGLRTYSAGGRELLDGYPATELASSGRDSCSSRGRTGSATGCTGSMDASTGCR